MAAPVINSITFDKATYNPNDTVTATVVFAPGTSPKSFTLTVTAVDNATQGTGTLTMPFSVNEPDATSVSGTDTGNRTWKSTITGNTAILTSTA